MKDEFYTFPGLQMKTIKHPDEDAPLYQVLQNKTIQSLLEKANNMSAQFFSAVILGSYIELSKDTAPRLFEILQDVCRILNFPEQPRIFTCHLMEQAVIPCGNKEKYLVISDYTADEFNEEELYYLFGNAVTMYKAGHTDLANLLNFVSGQIPLPLRLPLLSYLRAADLTSDRGGLLACQSLAAAARCHFHELGLPLCESRKLLRTDEEAEVYIKDYLSSVKITEAENQHLFVHFIKGVQNLTYYEGPANKMLSELYEWYMDPRGYRRILRTQGRPRGAAV